MVSIKYHRSYHWTLVHSPGLRWLSALSERCSKLDKVKFLCRSSRFKDGRGARQNRPRRYSAMPKYLQSSKRLYGGYVCLCLCVRQFSLVWLISRTQWKQGWDWDTFCVNPTDDPSFSFGDHPFTESICTLLHLDTRTGSFFFNCLNKESSEGEYDALRNRQHSSRRFCQGPSRVSIVPVLWLNKIYTTTADALPLHWLAQSLLDKLEETPSAKGHFHDLDTWQMLHNGRLIVSVSKAPPFHLLVLMLGLNADNARRALQKTLQFRVHSSYSGFSGRYRVPALFIVESL
jgi:ribosomal protein L34E